MILSLPKDWEVFIKEELESIQFDNLLLRVQDTYALNSFGIFPPLQLVFNAFEGILPSQVRVVLLGQDPYPTKGHAHGLAFSVDTQVNPLPRSLSNIFKELQNDVGTGFPKHGNLNAWKMEGVLLLNSVLTVVEGKPGSHSGIGWQKFTDAVIHRLSEQNNPMVFMLWGASAQQKVSLINRQKHLILCATHPSPLSAYRGFFGCRHFSQANDFLSLKQRSTIAW